MNLKRPSLTTWLLIVSALICVACGGGGEAIDTSGIVTDAKVTIIWPERSRDHIPAPGSALSAAILAQGAAPGGGNVQIFITREDNVSLHTGEYPIGQPMTHAPHNFTSTFFSEEHQGGEIVGEANGQITWNGNTAVWTIIDFTQNVKSVKVLGPKTVAVGPTPTQLTFEADGTPGHTVPVTPGSAHWTLVSGAGATLTADGKLTAPQAGTITVKVTVDGITSSNTDITATTGAVDHVTFEDRYDVSGEAEMTVAAAPGLIGGAHYVNDFPHACVWTATGFHEVHPTSERASWINAGSGGTWGGWSATDGFNGRPALFGGGLTLLSNNDGQVLGMEGDTQVGILPRQAAVWKGTIASFKSIHQDPWRESYAQAISGGTIAGYLDDTPVGPRHAAIWEGPNHVVKDLHPSGAQYSALYAISGNTQGGYVLFNPNYHAALWHGTAASVIDINPSIASNSLIYGLTGDVAVGYYIPVINDSKEHACIWNGSASKFIDLNAVLGADYDFGSRAVGVVAEPGGYMVVGSSERTLSNQSGGRHPIIWHVPSSLLN